MTSDQYQWYIEQQLEPHAQFSHEGGVGTHSLTLKQSLERYRRKQQEDAEMHERWKADKARMSDEDFKRTWGRWA